MQCTVYLYAYVYVYKKRMSNKDNMEIVWK